MDTARSLTENLAALLRREHHALSEFLVALADFDRQRCWVELGYSSLFYFLYRELGLSKASAQYRASPDARRWRWSPACSRIWRHRRGPS